MGLRGACYRSSESLKGNGTVSYEPRDVTDHPGPRDARSRPASPTARVRESFELPREVRGGIWYAPYPELRIELDASFQSWSSLQATVVTYRPTPSTPRFPTETTPRDWKDTISLRLGIEGDVTDHFLLFGGVAREPSPVPDRTVEPGFPRGDAMVYAAGFGYNFPQLSFDLAYSFHTFDSRSARTRSCNPAVTGTYSGRDSVCGLGAVAVLTAHGRDRG